MLKIWEQKRRDLYNYDVTEDTLRPICNRPAGGIFKLYFMRANFFLVFGHVPKRIRRNPAPMNMSGARQRNLGKKYKNQLCLDIFFRRRKRKSNEGRGRFSLKY